MNKIDIKHPDDRYENIFNMYEGVNSNNNSYVFYNIFNKVSLSDDIDPNVFELFVIPSSMPLTTVSFRVYQSMYLWWLIALTNNIRNPVRLLTPGSVIRVIKPEFLNLVLASIQKKQ